MSFWPKLKLSWGLKILFQVLGLYNHSLKLLNYLYIMKLWSLSVQGRCIRKTIIKFINISRSTALPISMQFSLMYFGKLIFTFDVCLILIDKNVTNINIKLGVWSDNDIRTRYVGSITREKDYIQLSCQCGHVPLQLNMLLDLTCFLI